MADILAWWVNMKIWLVWTTGLSRDALHIHLALVLLIGAAIALRRRPDSIACWTVVLLFELVNEAMDGLHGARNGTPWLAESGRDLVNTMVWPTMILIFGRWLWPGAADADDRMPAAEEDVRP